MAAGRKSWNIRVTNMASMTLVMKAVSYTEYGDASVLTVGPRGRPDPGPHDVLIKPVMILRNDCTSCFIGSLILITRSTS